MFDLTKHVLGNCYYYARFMGVLNFEIDLKTGLARITKRATIYAALRNLLTITVMIWLFDHQVVVLFWSRSGRLHQYLFLAIMAGRILCVMVTLITRWGQRPRYVRLVNDFQRLAHKKPHVMKLWKRGVISKVVSITLSELFQMLINFVILHEFLTLQMSFTIVAISSITAQVNVIVSQYYFGLLNIHGHYILINEELRLLLNEIRSLETERRKGVFTIKCCELADQLDVIAEIQFKLQALVKQITSIFGLQIITMSTSYYMSSVALVYFCFTEIRTAEVTGMLTSWGRVLIVLEFVCYFTDIHITVHITYAIHEVHATLVNLLSNHTVFGNGLDERLEVTLRNFQIQLACNPMKITVLGMYEMKKSRAIATVSSVVSSSLVLVQYNLRNF
ncbi:putative gustatory receptor 59d [Drosophila nasuta]|uniref:putative gustatory receptor 59d n=1 Tax=Drosophila nasuta TaxID=42062 RepID=UPI00295F1E92|nr:putative gustatory receptor 59d [Drosophila nasuta]